MDIENTNQPSVTIEGSNQNQQSLPKDQTRQSKKVIIILGIIIVLFAFGIGGYFLGASKNSTAPQPQQVTVSPAVTQPFPTNNPILTENSTNTDWKTYTNDYWKFQFQYPPTWALIPGYKPTDTSFEIINFDYEAHRPQSQEESLSQTPIQPPPEFRIAIAIYPNYTKSDQLLQEFEQSKGSEKFTVSNIKRFQINSYPAIEYNLTSSANVSIVDTNIENNQKYIISFRYWKKMKTTQDIPNYYKILSTFRLTD